MWEETCSRRHYREVGWPKSELRFQEKQHLQFEQERNKFRFLALNCLAGKMGIRLSVCPAYSQSVTRNQTRSQVGEAVKKLLGTFHGQKPPLMCWVGLKEELAWVHLHTPARLPGLCLDAEAALLLHFAPTQSERYGHVLLFLCADAEIKAQGDEVNFP